MANLPRPPLITKIEPKSRHAAIDSSRQQSRLTNLLVGKDTFFRGPGQAPVYDWPNPVGYDLRSRAQPSVGLKTWTTNTTRFIGFDSFFGAPGETKTYDWPNPTGHHIRSKAQPSVDLKTWIDPLNILLIGQDRIYGGPGQVADYDWPNPRGPRQPINVRMPANVVLYAAGNFPAGMQLYPAQGVRRVNQNVLNWLPPNLALYAPAVAAATTVFRMPVYAQRGIRRVNPNIILTWIDHTKIHLIGQDRIYAGPGQVPRYEWNNPRGSRQPMFSMLMVSENRLVLGATTDAFFEGFQRIEWGIKPQTAAGMGGVLFE